MDERAQEIRKKRQRSAEIARCRRSERGIQKAMTKLRDKYRKIEERLAKVGQRPEQPLSL
jgi:hypothetical protein